MVTEWACRRMVKGRESRISSAIPVPIKDAQHNRRPRGQR
jgi:hypothetical protein